jgi:ferredoxin-NADP reductase
MDRRARAVDPPLDACAAELPHHALSRLPLHAGALHPARARRRDDLVWRPYSLASAAYDDFLEFIAVLVPGGAFSEPLRRLRVGDTIRVDKASYGFLTVDQLAPGKDLWMLASGTGLGPFLSILRDPRFGRTTSA